MNPLGALVSIFDDNLDELSVEVFLLFGFWPSFCDFDPFGSFNDFTELPFKDLDWVLEATGGPDLELIPLGDFLEDAGAEPCFDDFGRELLLPPPLCVRTRFSASTQRLSLEVVLLSVSNLITTVSLLSSLSHSGNRSKLFLGRSTWPPVLRVFRTGTRFRSAVSPPAAAP